MTALSIAAHPEGKVAKWWMPDDVFVDALSYRANGQDPEDDEVAPRLRGSLFVAREIDGVMAPQAA